MAYTNTEILEQIKTAISEILTKGQTVEFDGKKYDRANVKELMELRKYYQGLVNSEIRNGHPMSKPYYGVKLR